MVEGLIVIEGLVGVVGGCDCCGGGEEEGGEEKFHYVIVRRVKEVGSQNLLIGGRLAGLEFWCELLLGDSAR